MSLAESLDCAGVAGEVFNFSPENPWTVLELVAVIQRLMGCEHLQPEVRNSVQGEIRSQYLDATKARQVLGWRPQFTLEQGLAETIAWYQEYLKPELHSTNSEIGRGSGQ
jgi:CDP-glucose 4,6-dehydratase